MPNCDFYSLEKDHSLVLDFVFSETDCEVHELHSEIGQDLRVFESAEDALTAYGDVPWQELLLNLYSPSMKGSLLTRRVALDVDKFGQGACRYSAEGWGAIQLYLRGMKDGTLENSHTNHNSEKRAKTWSKTVQHLGPPEAWDWREVVRISRRINRFIRRAAVSIHGSRPVLPQAEAWRRDGGRLA